MNVLIIYAHPETQSFNGAMFRTAVKVLTAQGHEVKFTDLYAQAFNPVSDRSNFKSVFNAAYFKQQQEETHATEVNGFAGDIASEHEKLLWCDLMVWQFPLWWFSMPAILKGWVDRVFAMGKVYGNGKLYESGTFQGKKSLLSLTTGGTPEAYVKGGFNGDLAGILRPIQRGILEFTGFSVLEPHVVYGPVRKTGEELVAELEIWQLRLKSIGLETPVKVGIY